MAPTRNGSETDGRGFVAIVGRFWQKYHASDYVGFLVLLTGWIVMALFLEPFHHMFIINDPHIMYPHAEVERVNVPLNFVYALFIPLGVIVAYNLITRASAHKHEVTYLSLAVSIVMTSFVVDLIKNAVGRPRPDLIARCKPKDGTLTDVLVTVDVCTQPNHFTLHDGWRSFPSGHSSFAFAGLGFLSFFLAGQLHIFRHETGGRDLGRAIVCLVPLLGALLIAISRYEDYRHDVYDICVGSGLGLGIAYWSYRRHWPKLTDRDCHEPYPDSKSGWDRVRDEEEGDASPASNLD